MNTPWITVIDPRAVLASGRGSSDTVCLYAVPSKTRRHATPQQRRSIMFLFDQAMQHSTMPSLDSHHKEGCHNQDNATGFAMELALLRFHYPGCMSFTPHGC